MDCRHDGLNLRRDEKGFVHEVHNETFFSPGIGMGRLCDVFPRSLFPETGFQDFGKFRASVAVGNLAGGRDFPENFRNAMGIPAYPGTAQWPPGELEMKRNSGFQRNYAEDRVLGV